MQQSNQEIYPNQTDEIDLRKLFNSLVEKKLFIFSVTAFVTLLAIIYVKTISPIYNVTSDFALPDDSSILNINRLELTSESKESIFSDFLTVLASNKIQKKVFDGGYLSSLNPENKPIDDVEKYISDFLNKIKIKAPITSISTKEKVGELIEKPYSISMEGSDPKIISKFLNELVDTANHENISVISQLIKLKIGVRLDEISLERDQLLGLAERDRLSKIERIKEEDAQKIREINDQIDSLRVKAKRDRINQIERIKEEDAQKIREINDQMQRLRFKAKESRLNQIIVLTDAARLAGSLGIIENNLNQINETDDNTINFNIAINEDADLPDWYLYGEKALLERIGLLENRISDDPFIPEIVTLTNQLNEVQNNNLLKTLEARQDDDPFIAEIVNLKKALKEVQLNNTLKTLEVRQDDSPFIAEITKLDIERIKLDSAIIDMTGISSMTVLKDGLISPISQKKRLIVLLAFLGAFMMSIFLALIMGALRPDEQAA